MSIRTLFVGALSRLYPAEWRAEYGEELWSLLSLRPITPRIFADVVLSATRERLRREGWKIFGVALLVWTVLGIVLNNAVPLSHEGSQRYENVWEAILFLTGCFTIMRNPGAGPSRAAVKAALIGFIPEMILLMLWAVGLFQPLVTKAAGPHTLLESRLALFDMTFPTAPKPGIMVLPFATAVIALQACMIGLLGGLAGRAMLFLFPRLRVR